MKMMLYVLTFAFLVIVGYIFIFKQMPEYSLQQIQHAAAQKDQATFEKYVDVDLLSGSLAEQFIRYVATDEPDTLVSPQLEEAVAAYDEAQLQSIFKEIVTDFIRNGKYPEVSEVSNSQRTTTPTSMLMRLQDVIVEELEFQGFNTMDKAAEFATVHANFYVPSRQKNLKLAFTMKDMGKYWQIVEVHQVDKFLKDLQ